MAKEKAARPTRDELAKYFDLEEQRLALGRQTKDVGKLQTAIEEKVLEYVRQNGGPERVCIVCGYRLSIEIKNGSVQWKTELLKILGPEEGLAKVEEISSAAEKREAVKIEPPA